MTDTKKKWEPFKEWDVITGTTDGGVIWRRYGDGLLVVARPGEMPGAGVGAASPARERQRPEDQLRER